MVAIRAKPTDKIQNGPRPINLQRDTAQIVSLLELVFRQQLNKSNRRNINPALGSQSFLQNLLQTEAYVPGFVWVVDGKIVANVTLLSGKNKERFLIANVAVHPDFRRQGIAHALMREVVNWTKTNYGNSSLFLQVEDSNLGAKDLYRSLGFRSLDTAHIWTISSNHVRSLPIRSTRSKPDHYETFLIRPLRGNEWQTAYDLDKACVDPDMNWPEPLRPDDYKSSLKRWWNNVVGGQQQEVWVAEDYHSAAIIGLGTIKQEWARPHQLRLRVSPEWRGPLKGVERAMLAKLIRRTRHLRRRPVQMDHLSSDEAVSDLMREAGFNIRRTLTTMYFHHSR